MANLLKELYIILILAIKKTFRFKWLSWWSISASKFQEEISVLYNICQKKKKGETPRFPCNLDNEAEKDFQKRENYIYYTFHEHICNIFNTILENWTCGIGKDIISRNVSFWKLIW